MGIETNNVDLNYRSVKVDQTLKTIILVIVPLHISTALNTYIHDAHLQYHLTLIHVSCADDKFIFFCDLSLSCAFGIVMQWKHAISPVYIGVAY